MPAGWSLRRDNFQKERLRKRRSFFCIDVGVVLTLMLRSFDASRLLSVKSQQVQSPSRSLGRDFTKPKSPDFASMTLDFQTFDTGQLSLIVQFILRVHSIGDSFFLPLEEILLVCRSIALRVIAVTAFGCVMEESPDTVGQRAS